MVRGSRKFASKFAQVRASSRAVRGYAGWFAQVRASSRTVRASSRAVCEVRAHAQLPYTIVHGWFSKFSLMVHTDSRGNRSRASGLRFRSIAYMRKERNPYSRSPNLIRSREAIKKRFRSQIVQRALQKLGGLLQKRCVCLFERAMARGGASLDAARATLGEPRRPDPAHPLP